MISVIIPTYNRAETIEKSVRSVLNQTYKDIELIIVDDCSTDNTKEIVESIDDSRVRYACLEKNQGACAARNRGIEMARGEYIAFQDSDDIWKSQKLDVQLKRMLQSDADVCFCNMVRYNTEKKLLGYFPKNLKEGIIPYETLFSYSHVSTQTILAKREIFSKYIFDELVTKSQDYDWVIRSGEEYVFYYVEEVLVEQYFQNDSITKKGNIKSIEMCEYFLEKYKDKCTENIQFHVALLNQIGHNKTILGKNAASIYKEIYKLTGQKKALFQYILSKTYILLIYYRFKYRKKI